MGITVFPDLFDQMTGKIKILFLIGHYGTGGKERQLTEIIKGLPKDKYEIHLFIKSVDSYYLDQVRDRLATFRSLDKQHFGVFDITKLGRYVKKIMPEVVFSFSTTASHFFSVLKAIRFHDIRLINGSIRDAPVDFNMHMRLEKVLYNLYREVVANSKAGLRAYNQSGKKGRHVLYNGFDESRVPIISKEELREQLGLNVKFTVVMIASMGDTKDQPTFIKAGAKVLEVSDDAQFFLVGDGPKKPEYLSLVSSLGLENDIFFTGEVNNPEQYLKASDLFVLMSTNAEGFPNVVLESLACGTPVIANDNGGTKEVVGNNNNGYLIKSGDFETLAKKITFLKNNPHALKSFSINGLETIKNHFSTEKMISKFDQLLLKK